MYGLRLRTLFPWIERLAGQAKHEVRAVNVSRAENVDSCASGTLSRFDRAETVVTRGRSTNDSFRTPVADSLEALGCLHARPISCPHGRPDLAMSAPPNAPAHAISQLTIATPDDFVDKLNPRSEPWRRSPSSWVFRGQGDARWPLVPSAFRDNAILVDPNTLTMRRGPLRTVFEQVQAEIRTLRMFLGQANLGGLPFAKDDETIFFKGAYFEEWVPFLEKLKDDPNQWPPDKVLPNLALAQHYGIPTRLLDWTTSALVAGYFAARTAAERWQRHRLDADAHELSNDFCLWALRVGFLNWAAELG